MLTRILGESQRRAAIIHCLERILYPLDSLILKITWFKELEICMPVGDFRLFFRPFLFSDLIILFTDYEPYIKRIFQPSKGETVLDVGAHIGIYTLNAAKNVGPSGTIVSFEPDQRNLRLLKKNIKINGFRGVKTVNAALDKNKSEKFLYLTDDPLFTSMSPSEHSKEKIKVETLTLDDVAETLNLTHIDWIKIDVEGNELKVLEGGKRTFSNCVDRVIIETSNPDVLRFLSDKGFIIQKLFGINYLAIKIQ
jgi:FkbM family methyltransferase